MEKTLSIMVTIKASSENDAVTALKAFNEFVNTNKGSVEISYDFSTVNYFSSPFDPRGK